MILGIDIGGTNVKFGVVDENYHVVKGYSIPTGAARGDLAIVNDIIAQTKKIQEEFAFTRIGIGSPGNLDCDNGICVGASNLP